MDENNNIKKAPNVPPFLRYCSAIIPTAFDDSLSYYEALCALYKFLQNQVIDTINNNANVTQYYIGRQNELEALFKQLKEYVDNYFDNLDVQEEINNKLDAMVEAGTLQEIIGEYLNSSAVWGFDSVADMKSASNLIDGSYAHTLGYYSKNDGGEALYKIREITNDDVVDEKFIIEMNDGADNLVAELICDNQVNICQVGGQQNTASVINSLITAGKDVYIPDGDFTITETIVFNHGNTEFICDGNISSTTALTYFKINSSNNKISLNGSVTGWQTSGTNTPVLMEIGSDSNYVEYNTVFVKVATVFAKGFYTQPNNGKGVSYLNVTFSHIEALTGIHISSGDVGANYVNENTFNGGRLTSDYGIVFTKGANQTDQYNGNVFNNIAVEKANIIQCIDLNYASFNNFNDMRISEGLATSEHPIHIGNGCRDNLIQTKYQLRTSQIYDENTSSSPVQNRTYFNACYCLDGYDRISRGFCTYKGIILVNENQSYRNNFPNIRNQQDTNEDGTETLQQPEYILDGGTVIKLYVSYAVNKIIKLPVGMDYHGITKFYLVIPYKENGSTITIQDHDGNTIMDSSILGTSKIQNKVYTVEYLGNVGVGAITRRWVVKEV